MFCVELPVDVFFSSCYSRLSLVILMLNDEVTFSVSLIPGQGICHLTATVNSPENKRAKDECRALLQQLSQEMGGKISIRETDE